MPTNPNLVELIWIFTAMLLPLIPAILLFKYLPAAADVSGPFQGLQVKLGGSVAIYFLLVLIISFGPRPTTPDEVWTVKGWVQDENGESLAADKVNMSIQPKTVEYRNDGSFEMSILVKRTNVGQKKLPILNVDWQPAQAFGNAIVHLDDTEYHASKKYKISLNEATREIGIDQAIQLAKRIPETVYKPTDPLPQPTTLPVKLTDPAPTPTPTPKP